MMKKILMRRKKRKQKIMKTIMTMKTTKTKIIDFNFLIINNITNE